MTVRLASSFIAIAIFCGPALAQSESQQFEKKNYSYSEWAKGIFSDAVTVSGPSKTIYLAGIGAEDEAGKPGDIKFKDDFAAQCRYAYEKIKRALEKNGASFSDVVKITSYVTDIRYQRDVGKCRADAFGGAPMPAHTFLNVSQLAWPGMLVEMDVIAVTPVK